MRLPEDTEARLQAVAMQSGLTKADVIRRAVEAYLDEVERTGSINFPLRAERTADVNSDNDDNDNSDEAILRRIFRSEHEAAAKARRPAKRQPKPGVEPAAGDPAPARSPRSKRA